MLITVSLFTTFLVNSLLATLVLFKNRIRAANRYLAVFIYSTAGWVFSILMLLVSKAINASILWGKLAFGFAAMIPASLLLFSFVFPKDEGKLSRLKKYLILVPAFVFIALLPTNLLSGEVAAQNLQIRGNPGSAYPFFMIYFMSFLLVFFYRLFDKNRTAAGFYKVQIQYIFLGVLLFAIFATSTNLILPAFGVYLFNGLGPLFSIIMVGFMTYAIVKHRLMDIRFLVLKSVAYSVTLAIIAVGYAAAAYLLFEIFGGLVNQNVIDILVLFAAILGFVPLKRFIEKYTDRIFAKGRYNFEELLEKLGKLMSTRAVLKDLAISTLETLVKEMRLNRAAFVVIQGSSIAEVEAIGHKSKSVAFWDKAAKLVDDRKEIIIADELEEDSKEKEVLRRLNTEVLLPLRTEESIVGILALGEKRSGDMFTAQDIRLLEIIAPEAAIAVNNASLFKEKEKRIEELNSLNKLALSLGSTLHLDQLLEEVMDEAIKVTEAETGSIMLLDEETRTLRVKAARGIPAEVYKRVKMKVGEGISGWVAKTSEPTIIIDSEHENEYLRKCLKREEITSALCIPLKMRNKVIGVICVSRKKKKEVFTEDSLNLLSSYAAQAAEAIENARLFEKSEKQFMETIRTLSGAVEAKDPYTRGHSDAVTECAVSIAKEMGLPQEEVRNIKIAGRLHDIGKIGIPEAILNKPGRLSKEEREIINQHPKISVDILKPAGSLNDIIPTILYHHERFDGKGYPTGLAGKAIPLGARILGVADSFNAMTTDRPYRLALSLGDTIRELKENAGAQFDPDVVEALLKVLETSAYKCEAKVRRDRKQVKPLTTVS